MEKIKVTWDGKNAYEGYVIRIKTENKFPCAFLELDVLREMFKNADTEYEPKYDEFRVYDSIGEYDIYKGEDVEVEDGVFKHLYPVYGWPKATNEFYIINCCGDCPYFETFLEEYEDGVGYVEEGRCHKHDEYEIWATRTPCLGVGGRIFAEVMQEWRDS